MEAFEAQERCVAAETCAALPQELIETFVNLLESHLDITSCSLVCQNWRAASVSRLFSSISIPTKAGLALGSFDNVETADRAEIDDVFNTVLGVSSIFHDVTQLTLDWAYSNAIFEHSLPHFHRLVFPRLSELIIARLYFDEATDSYLSPIADIIKSNSTIGILTFRGCRFQRPFISQHRLIEILVQCGGPSSLHLSQFNLEQWGIVDEWKTEMFDLISFQRPSDGAIMIRSSDVRMQTDHIMGCVGLTIAVRKLMELGSVHSMTVQGVRLQGIQESLTSSTATLQRLSVECHSLDQHRLISHIADNCPNLQSLTLRFDSLGCGLNIYISHGAFLDLRSLHSLRELIIGLDIMKYEGHSSLLHSIANLDLALTPVVQEMPSLFSVVVSVEGGALKPDTCLTRVRDARPGLLQAFISGYVNVRDLRASDLITDERPIVRSAAFGISYFQVPHFKILGASLKLASTSKSLTYFR
ncbi:hypothetical protein BT96DRAFT_1013144 [Gymnopus androsaceus JB14]|uniref:F-box domain-containing protein n=1 Tax=Gymnopus androsaceus JB14 TaxID=1447944 RepID=A0A6A4IEH5_9AGAR|nr:hypothetical protein BT96DRAFT_1013144 [Gymnopus androsaceus JB14]